jgi:hypothetical protein
MKIIALILTIVFSVNSLAVCDNAVTLRKGDTVKDCDRIGYSLEYDKTVRADLVEGDYNKKIVEEQKKLIELKDLSISLNQKQSELWKEEAMREREAYDKERNKGNKSLWLGIALGVLLTVGAGYAIGQASKASR